MDIFWQCPKLEGEKVSQEALRSLGGPEKKLGFQKEMDIFLAVP